MLAYLKEAANVKPTQKQLDWFEMGAYAFVHFGVNTYTDKEWGDGSEDAALFNPTELDCDQWVEAIKSAGLKGLILTAKHHDGFCLWPSKYTEYSVKNSPFKGDVVKQAAKACQKGGIKFGIYLSPWDRHSELYGTSAYNDYFCNQLTELLTNYGDIFYVWFDNANGEGPNGKKQIYDFPRYFELIRKYQSQAMIFNDYGPDIRWCGNEAGVARPAEWAVVPNELTFYAPKQTNPGPLSAFGNLDYLYSTDNFIGTLPNILYSKGLSFVPSEMDTSIRKGWFWHPNETPHSVEKLFHIYLNSVGHNACLNLNIPPNQKGLFDEKDVKRLKEFGAYLKKEPGHPYPIHQLTKEDISKTQPIYTIETNVSISKIKYVVLKEDIKNGQRIESFRIVAKSYNGAEYPLYQGTTVGYKKICQLYDPFKDQNPLLAGNENEVRQLSIQVTAARDTAMIKEIEIF